VDFSKLGTELSIYLMSLFQLFGKNLIKNYYEKLKSAVEYRLLKFMSIFQLFEKNLIKN